jgi:phospholipid-binding lipoprotein MlaA
MKNSVLAVALSGILLTGCASSPTTETSAAAGGRSDPIEGFNRTMFDFNYNVLDPYLLRPVAIVWNDYMPKPARTGLSNVSNNLGEPATMVNYLLQGEVKQAVKHLHRFVINSTFGLGGLIDFATHDEGLRRTDNRRFGSVLGHYDVGYGPYVVLPGYGSATPREDIGGIVDDLYPPLSWLVGWPAVGKWVLDGIETRARFLDQDQLLRNSEDPYLFMREAYFQNKDFQASDGKIGEQINPNAAIIEDDLSDIDSMQ